METESLLPNNKPTYDTIKRYFRRRRYHRLDGGGTTGGKKMKVIRLKGIPPRRNWRLKASPKLRWRWVVMSPLKMLCKLKNAYMNFMLKTMNPDNIFKEKQRIPKASKGLSSNHAFEARLIFEISKALVASHELYP
ncbi:hypothetical protein RIF29_13969 [Crotalaria pallida]|uniref:Uncharacterized protein n=1 Tax=Crotalaria pallida TaxID=3830 RepID=A0AAN9FEM4_CROPI